MPPDLFGGFVSLFSFEIESHCLVQVGIEQGTHHLAQAGLKLMILLHQPPHCWDYSMYHCAQLYVFTYMKCYLVLEILV